MAIGLCAPCATVLVKLFLPLVSRFGCTDRDRDEETRGEGKGSRRDDVIEWLGSRASVLVHLSEYSWHSAHLFPFCAHLSRKQRPIIIMLIYHCVRLSLTHPHVTSLPAGTMRHADGKARHQRCALGGAGLLDTPREVKCAHTHACTHRDPSATNKHPMRGLGFEDTSGQEAGKGCSHTLKRQC